MSVRDLRAVNNFLGGFDYPLKPPPVCLSAAAISDGDAISHQTLNGRAVEGQQQISAEVILPEHPHEV